MPFRCRTLKNIDAERTAWPYERQALVNFRSVAGDFDLDRLSLQPVIERSMSRANLNSPPCRTMRERQIRQLVRGGAINAKLSDGGIVDCEYAVQSLPDDIRHNDAIIASSEYAASFERGGETEFD